MTNSTDQSGSWERLGVLLKQRRAELGYRSRQAFTAATKLDYRLIYDIEEARRVNFGVTTLTAIEIGYRIRPGSIEAYVNDGAGLEPLTDWPSVAYSRPGEQDWLTPEEVRDARLFADPIFRRLLELERQGVERPGGRDVFPDEPRWAEEWDLNRKDLDDDKIALAWLIADAKTRIEAARIEARRRHGTGLERGDIADEVTRASQFTSRVSRNCAVRVNVKQDATAS